MQIKGFCVSKSEPSFLGSIIATKLIICYCFAIRQRKDRKKPAKWQIDLKFVLNARIITQIQKRLQFS